MNNEQDTSAVRHVDTPSGRIGYVEVGSGPVALFVHGVLLNKHMWRYQLAALSDFPRCIAVDLLAHGDKSIYRSPGALGPAYEHPEAVRDEDIEIYLWPHLRNEQRTHDLERFVGAFDNKHTLAIEPQLRQLKASTLIVWATDDVYFPVKWAHWLADAIPGARPPVELSGARLFLREERADAFNQLLRGHWAG